MKRKLSKAGGKALSVALAMATVVSAAPFSVAAEDNVALAQTQETEGNALRLWYDEEAPNSYTGWEQWALPLGNSAIGASVFGGVQTERKSRFGPAVLQTADRNITAVILNQKVRTARLWHN